MEILIIIILIIVLTLIIRGLIYAVEIYWRNNMASTEVPKKVIKRKFSPGWECNTCGCLNDGEDSYCVVCMEARGK